MGGRKMGKGSLKSRWPYIAFSEHEVDLPWRDLNFPRAFFVDG